MDKKTLTEELYGDWTCWGLVRGECGTIHRTRQVSKAHCLKDGKGCNRMGGYSDRSPRLVRPPIGRIVPKTGREGTYSLIVRSQEQQYASKAILLRYCEERGIGLGYVAS